MFVGFALAIFVGITLGMVGSGGTILTVPILVYVMGVDPILSTTYSLFAIGITSSIGAVRGVCKSEVDIPKVLTFGLPSLLMVFITRTFFLPLVPPIIRIGVWDLQQSVVLMFLFAFVMLSSAFAMIQGDDKPLENNETTRKIPLQLVVAQGIVVGLVTGIVGVGGGFLIIPALVNFYRMPIRRAVSTSLVIITINSFFGVLGDVEKFEKFDWYLILGYTIFTIVGLFLGFILSNKVSGTKLKKMFGYMILIVALSVLIHEIINL